MECRWQIFGCCWSIAILFLKVMCNVRGSSASRGNDQSGTEKPTKNQGLAAAGGIAAVLGKSNGTRTTCIQQHAAQLWRLESLL